MKPTFIAVLVFASFTALRTASAITIDFEAQGTAASSSFDNKLNSPLTIGLAKFTGGELLNHESFGGTIADPTVVYATSGFGTGYSDPLVITFSRPVSNASLLITNELPDTYTLTDNLGMSRSLVVGNNVNQTISLADTGINRLSLSTAGTVGWDFAVDNVSFATVPEIDANSCSSALALLAGALLILRGKKTKTA